MISRSDLVERRMQDFSGFVEQTVRLDDALSAVQSKDQAAFGLVRVCLQFALASLKSSVSISLICKAPFEY
jgi:hypothetical protein